uniref:Putative ribonuclease H-like domain-containing protein n=1 Tax=Tanacetum cinerariifolium TaxID=118510 RepID=A0A6L2N3Z8_TANCI|nr:putative ribonuclease H-like domain-containing protein [Tanacetum cinerariifolium]
MFDCDDYPSSESDCESWPPTSLYDRFQPSDGYHAVPLSYTGTFMPPKPDLVFNTAPTADWVSDSEDEYETKAPQIVPSFVQSSEQVKSPRHSVQHVETSIPPTTPKLASPKPASSGKIRNRKACFVCKSVDYLIKDCDYHAKKMVQPTQRNHAHRVLTQSKPVSITAVRPVSAAVPKIKVTRPRHAHPIVTKSKSPIRRDLTRSPSPMTSNSPPRVTAVKAPVVSAAQGNQTNPGAGFQDKFDAEKAGKEIDQQYVLFPVWYSGSTNPQNNDGDATFDGKEHDFDAKKPESEVSVSPSSSAQSRKQDDKTKKEARGKSPVESFIGYRDLSAEFEDCSDNNINELNAAEDITYSDDDDDVSTEADFNNLETSITEEPKRVHQALKDSSWIEAMQEELLQFKMQKVWVLVNLPHGKRAIGTKWVYRNKKDERGIVVRNKARLVTQGHTQEEGIDYEEVFAPIARIEAIRLFLAYASFMGFMVYQMDALYGLHQAPRAWYETLANYLLENGFQRGKIDQTLFIKRQKGDILLVQIYVDDIIFCATNKDLCKSFEKLMKDKFQTSSIRELTFFLGLQVNQKKDGIFINQDKYVAEILRKFRLTEGKLASTPINIEKPLLKDHDGEDVDVHTYRSMIGSLMYLTSSRPDIMFAICARARFQVTPKASHLYAVKRIFRYLKGKPYLGLWYPKDSPFDLVAYLDSDYAGASLDRKSTTGGCQFLGCRLIS